MPIDVTGIAFGYPGRPIFDGFSCHFAEGELTALVGPSGVGKSTLIALLIGQITPSSGRIDYPSRLLRGGRVDERRVAWIMQTANVLARRSALDNVSLPLVAAGAARTIASRRAAAALAEVGLAAMQGQTCGVLSGGERQRVTVARAVASDAALLIADEPTVSLDHANRDLLVATLRAACNADVIGIVATHDPAVYEACDRVVRL